MATVQKGTQDLKADVGFYGNSAKRTDQSGKVYIDGVEVPFADFTTSLYTYVLEDVFSIERDQQANVKGTISTLDGKFIFQIGAMEKDSAGNIYVYGPLRKMFPELFKDKELLPWQLAYLDNYGMPSYHKLKLWRGDSIFTIDQALHFKRGYEHAMTQNQKGK